jgi:hypothetical protein
VKLKICSKCKESKRLDRFPKTGASPHLGQRYHSYCKACWVKINESRRKGDRMWKKLSYKETQACVDSLKATGGVRDPDCNRYYIPGGVQKFRT